MTNNPPELEKPALSAARFSWKRIAKVAGVIAAIGVIVGGGYAVAISRPVKIAWASMASDRREHFLDCEHLPFFAQVEKVFSQHANVVAQVKVLPGVTSFEPEKVVCKIYEGGMIFIKGDAVLVYKGRATRKQAENIIGKDFFGMPYRGYESKDQ
jgi:hypothetical protein